MELGDRLIRTHNLDDRQLECPRFEALFSEMVLASSFRLPISTVLNMPAPTLMTFGY